MLEIFARKGLIRFYGASNYKLTRMVTANQIASTGKIRGFSAVSNQWSLASANSGSNINPDPSLAFMTEGFYKWHKETLTPMIPYSSTAFGFFEKLRSAGSDERKLPGDMRATYVNERNMRIYKELSRLSGELGVSVHALSLACLTNQPFDVIPINSVRNTQQLKDIIQASEVELDLNFTEKEGV